MKRSNKRTEVRELSWAMRNEHVPHKAIRAFVLEGKPHPLITDFKSREFDRRLEKYTETTEGPK